MDRQREACLARCAERGWEVLAIEADNDISAAGKRRRPGFERMLAAITEGKASQVVAWSLDRLQRNRRDELRLYEACKDHGASLSLVNGADIDFSTAAGRFVADSLGSVARFEIELKSDRQRAAQLQAARAGKRSGGPRPFGYEADGVTVRESEAQAIRQGYAAILAGESLGEVARTWNKAGLPPAQGRRDGTPGEWRRDNVRVVLLNPRNIGKRAYRGEVVADAQWPAIVDVPTYEAVKAKLSDSVRHSGRTSAKQLLSGLAVCGVCGATVHAGGAARAGVRNYRCSGSTGHFARMAEPIEDYVGRIIVARLSMPDARELMTRNDHPNVDALRSEADGIRARLTQLVNAFTDGAITDEQLRTGTERLRKRDAEIEAQLADAGRVDVLGPLVSSDDVRGTWEALPDARKRAVIETLMEVTIHPPGRGTRTFRPETVGIQWRTA